MLFYEILLKWKETEAYSKYLEESDVFHDKTPFEEKYNGYRIDDINEEFYMQYAREEKYMIYLTHRTCNGITAHVAVKLDALDKKEYLNAIRERFPDCDIVGIKEETIESYRREARDTHGYNNEILEKLGINYHDSVYTPLPFDYSEELLVLPSMTKAVCQKKARSILGSPSLMEEIDRIYSKDNIKQYLGHPVHYLVSTGEWGAAEEIINLLIPALVANGRLLTGRKSILRNIGENAYEDVRLLQVVKAAEGGVCIIELDSRNDLGMFATDFHEFTRVVGEIFGQQKKDTLFIFVELTGKSLKSSDAMGNITSKGDIIQICEGSGTRKQAEKYLLELAQKVDFITDDKGDVIEYLKEKESDSYTMTDIFDAYNVWYGSGLRDHVYKAYKTQKTVQIKRSVTESKPYDDLQSLIGLTEIKSVVDQIIATGRIKCIRERMGLKNDQSSLHMIFTGTPGTAKTTVARLLANILKDEDILKSGRFVECGRQDLVGKYVGWTAKVVEEKFKQACGGILFIDEAYSLLDDSNTYGDEAINTITQLMENYRDQVIVIFAGYPDKMEAFLNQNEGLRSRISFHLSFPDYTSSELVDILKLMAEKRDYTIAEDAFAECAKYLEEATHMDNFGNGRYVRSFLEHAITRQALRLQDACLGKEDAQLTKEEVCLLKKEDFAPLAQGQPSKKTRMGFAV